MTDEIKKESLLAEYQKEAKLDLELDRIILEEKQLKLPAIKGKWVARMMNHKKELTRLNDLYEDAIEQISAKLINEAAISISKVIAAKQAESHELAKKIRAEIKEQQHIIEYLEKMEKVFSSMTYDIRNLTDLIKLETT